MREGSDCLCTRLNWCYFVDCTRSIAQTVLLQFSYLPHTLSFLDLSHQRVSQIFRDYTRLAFRAELAFFSHSILVHHICEHTSTISDKANAGFSFTWECVVRCEHNVEAQKLWSPLEHTTVDVEFEYILCSVLWFSELNYEKHITVAESFQKGREIQYVSNCVLYVFHCGFHIFNTLIKLTTIFWIGFCKWLETKVTSTGISD